MEVEDNFEEWDELELFEHLDESELDNNESDSDSSEVEDSEDDSEEDVLKCSKCSKLYQVMGWLRKHEEKCDGQRKKTKKNKKMTPHQKKVRKVLTELGFDEYYRDVGRKVILSVLEEITNVDEETAMLRGQRFMNCKTQALNIIPEVSRPNVFFELVSSKLWTICFAKDNLQRSSTRQKHIAQEMHDLRNCQDLKTRWKELLNITGAATDDQLLLQRIITTVFGDISQYRMKSLEQAALIYDTQSTDNKATPVSLSNVEKDIVAYVGGYVCKKLVRDRLQRYITSNVDSKNVKVQEKCRSFYNIMNFISEQMIHGSPMPPTMTFPNLISTATWTCMPTTLLYTQHTRNQRQLKQDLTMT